MSSFLNISNISKAFGSEKVLSEVNLGIEENTICALVGESGSGKSTLMRIIAGLEAPDSGEITVSGNEILSQPPEKRNIGLVFQDYALFPHLTIEKNIAFGISKNRKKRTEELLSLVDLSGYEKRYPHQLSGGQQQRIAIARALAPDPSLLLLDEPFSNLDPIRRRELRQRIRKLVIESNTTAMIVTHDMEDALKVADHIIVLKEGKVIQTGTVEEIQSSPNCDYVRELMS